MNKMLKDAGHQEAGAYRVNSETSKFVNGRSLKVVYLDQYFNLPKMPGGHRAYEMAIRLANAGHTVDVVTSIRDADRGKKRDWISEVHGPINVHWLPVPYSNCMSYSERVRSFLKFSFHASKKAAEIDADVIFASSTPLTIALPGVYASRRRRIPMVFEVRDLWPEMPISVGALKHPVTIFLARKLETFSYRNSARIVALSEGMAEGIIASGYSKDKVSVIPNGCDLENFSTSNVREGMFRETRPELGAGPIVLYAGALGHVNDVGFLVDLASRFKYMRPEVRFVVLGEGAKEKSLRRYAEMREVLDKNFFMYSRLPKSEVVGAFIDAAISTSLFVDIPEMEKNSANKFFDGLASGTPVAINYGGWQAELLNQTGAGFVMSRNIDEAARTLETWLLHPAALQRAGTAARKLAETRFSRDNLAKQLERVLLAAAHENC